MMGEGKGGETRGGERRGSLTIQDLLTTDSQHHLAPLSRRVLLGPPHQYRRAPRAVLSPPINFLMALIKFTIER